MLNIHDILIKEAKKVKSDRVAVLLSSGIDSASVLFSLMETGKKVTAYSFRRNDRYSTDFIGARNIAKTFGVEFKEILLPTDLETIKKDVVFLAKL